MTALTAKLGLDASGLKRGAKEAADAVRGVSDEVETADSKLEKLGNRKLELKADASKARAEIGALSKELTKVDGRDARATVLADISTAKTDLDRIQDEIRQVDGETARINVETSGVDGAIGKLDSLGGQFGEVGASLKDALSGPGGAIAGASALFYSVKAIADQTATAALEAQTYADLTGVSVEYASGLLAVTQKVGVEATDLADMTLQMTQAFQDAPELAQQLGINLNDGKKPAERLVQVLELMNTSMLSAEDKAVVFGKLLGEEGVRQGQALATQVGDIGAAIDNLPDSVIFDKEEVERAKEYKRTVDELSTTIKGLVAEFGVFAMPMLKDSLEDAQFLADVLSNGADAADRLSNWAGLPDINLPPGAKDLLTGNVFGAFIEQGKEVQEVWGNTFGDGGLSGSLGEIDHKFADMFGTVANGWPKALAATEETTAAQETLARRMGEVASKTRDARDSIQEYADTQRAAVDPAFAVIKATQDYDAALVALNEENGNTVENQIAVVEAGLNVEQMLANLAAEGSTTAEEMVSLAKRFGLSEAAADELGAAVGGATEKAEDFVGDYEAKIIADTVSAVNGIQVVKNIANELDGKRVTIYIRTVEETIRTGSLPIGTNNRRDGGGKLRDGEIAQVAEVRPEYVNGVLILEPTTIQGPADIIGGSATGALLNSAQASAMISHRTTPNAVTAPLALPPVVQVGIGGRVVEQYVSRSVDLMSERETMFV